MKWNFAPKYSPEDDVWWIDEMIKNGKIVGIDYHYSKCDGMNRESLVYFVELSIDGTSKVYEIPESKLFGSREEALIFIETH